MELDLVRYNYAEDSTGGLLYVDGEFFGYTCEDETRKVKVYGETCIPEGRYEIRFRKAGTMWSKELAKDRSHSGMIHLQNVPGFEYIYIHIGNHEYQTDGCILVGLGAQLHNHSNDGFITRSKDAYLRLYKEVHKALNVRRVPVWINVRSIITVCDP